MILIYYQVNLLFLLFALLILISPIVSVDFLASAAEAGRDISEEDFRNVGVEI